MLWVSSATIQLVEPGVSARAQVFDTSAMLGCDSVCVQALAEEEEGDRQRVHSNADDIPEPGQF